MQDPKTWSGAATVGAPSDVGCAWKASQIKCHCGKWGNNRIETAILEVWVKPVYPRLIKSVVESSQVNPGRSIMATQQHYKQRPTHVPSPGVPLTVHTPQVIGGAQAALLSDSASVCERDASLLCVDQLNRGTGGFWCARRLWLAAVAAQGPHHFGSRWIRIILLAIDLSAIATAATPLLSPGWYFCGSEPVIFQGMKWTWDTSKTVTMYFLPKNTRRRRRGIQSPGLWEAAGKNYVFFSRKQIDLLTHAWALTTRITGLCRHRWDHVSVIKPLCCLTVMYSHLICRCYEET